MLHKRTFRAMGCEMTAILELDSEKAPVILDEVPMWFEAWERSLSRFQLDSELSRLNRTFDQPIQVSDVLWDVFQAALWADEISGGLVTPTVLDSMLEAGYDRPFDRLPRDQAGLMPASFVEIHPLSLVVVDEKQKSIALPKDVRLDLGGIAKGWAAHQTMEHLKELGPCLMNAGGDIAVSGPRLDGSPWPIGVSNPFETGTDIEVLLVRRGGVATSGRDRRQWRRNGTFQHHIIDPFTGLPAQTDLLRVTVLAPTAMEAEAAAKTAFILGFEKGMEWIEMHPDYAGVLILENGAAYHSRTMHKYL